LGEYLDQAQNKDIKHKPKENRVRTTAQLPSGKTMPVGHMGFVSLKQSVGSIKKLLEPHTGLPPIRQLLFVVGDIRKGHIAPEHNFEGASATLRRKWEEEDAELETGTLNLDDTMIIHDVVEWIHTPEGTDTTLKLIVVEGDPYKRKKAPVKTHMAEVVKQKVRQEKAETKEAEEAEELAIQREEDRLAREIEEMQRKIDMETAMLFTEYDARLNPHGVGGVSDGAPVRMAGGPLSGAAGGVVLTGMGLSESASAPLVGGSDEGGSVLALDGAHYRAAMIEEAMQQGAQDVAAAAAGFSFPFETADGGRAGAGGGQQRLDEEEGWGGDGHGQEDHVEADFGGFLFEFERQEEERLQTAAPAAPLVGRAASMLPLPAPMVPRPCLVRVDPKKQVAKQELSNNHQHQHHHQHHHRRSLGGEFVAASTLPKTIDLLSAVEWQKLQQGENGGRGGSAESDSSGSRCSSSSSGSSSRRKNSTKPASFSIALGRSSGCDLQLDAGTPNMLSKRHAQFTLTDPSQLYRYEEGDEVQANYKGGRGTYVPAKIVRKKTDGQFIIKYLYEGKGQKATQRAQSIRPLPGKERVNKTAVGVMDLGSQNGTWLIDETEMDGLGCSSSSSSSSIGGGIGGGSSASSSKPVALSQRWWAVGDAVEARYKRKDIYFAAKITRCRMPAGIGASNAPLEQWHYDLKYHDGGVERSVPFEMIRWVGEGSGGDGAFANAGAAVGTSKRQIREGRTRRRRLGPQEVVMLAEGDRIAFGSVDGGCLREGKGVHGRTDAVYVLRFLRPGEDGGLAQEGTQAADENDIGYDHNGAAVITHTSSTVPLIRNRRRRKAMGEGFNGDHYAVEKQAVIDYMHGDSPLAVEAKLQKQIHEKFLGNDDSEIIGELGEEVEVNYRREGTFVPGTITKVLPLRTFEITYKVPAKYPREVGVSAKYIRLTSKAKAVALAAAPQQKMLKELTPFEKFFR
jgi:hypothetical protein